MKKSVIWIIIILAVIILLGILFLSDKISENGIYNINDCKKLRTDYDNLVEKNNYCEVNDDCVAKETSPSLGCLYIVNKNTVDEIEKLASKYNKCRSSYRGPKNAMLITCFRPQPINQIKIECIDNECVEGLPGFPGIQVRIYFYQKGIVKIKQGDLFRVAFGIRNNIRKTQKIMWNVIVANDNIEGGCGVSETIAESWITAGSFGSFEIVGGQVYSEVIKFNIPKGAIDVSKCNVGYNLVIKQEDGDGYSTNYFIVEITK